MQAQVGDAVASLEDSWANAGHMRLAQIEFQPTGQGSNNRRGHFESHRNYKGHARPSTHPPPLLHTPQT